MALTEADIQELADSIVHGSEERMVAELFGMLCDSLAGGAMGLADEAALEQLASANAAKAAEIVAEYADAIDDEARALVESALLDASDADEASLSAVYGQEAASQAVLRFAGGYSAHFLEIAAQTASGVAEVIRRQNLAMAERAERLWYEAAGEAVAAFSQGLLPREECAARAVSRVMAEGMETIDYASGVSNQLDVAVRRHVVTQASQAGGRMTLDRMEAYGHELVVTSAHYGARPSHAEWQGKPCAIHGAAEVDGVRYPGLAELTGYGTVGGLKGANCRHSINPYYPGITPLPEREWPEHEARFGMSSEEYYEATQRQRELERRVRKTKREVAGMEQAGVGLESPTYVQKRLTLGRQQAALRDHCARNGLVRQYARERAYGVKSQPRALAKEPWKRTADELLRTPAAERSLRARGITKKAARQGIADAMAERGGTLADFATMTAGEQQSVFRSIVEKLNGTAKARRGKHAAPRFVPATTIEEALDFAESNFGVTRSWTMFDKIGLDGSNLINEAVYGVTGVIGSVSLRGIRYQASLGANAVAAYAPSWNGLFFSRSVKGKNARRNMAKMQKSNHDAGWWSSPNELGIVHHEMGHYAHFRLDGANGSTECDRKLESLLSEFRDDAANGVSVDWDAWGSPGSIDPDVMKRAASNGLSGYALSNTHEMVAEAFAQLYDGNVSDASKKVLKTLLRHADSIDEPENALLKRRLERL